MWANSYAVGCGAYKCDEIEDSEDVEGNGLLFVCFYGPGYVLTCGYSYMEDVLIVHIIPLTQWKLCRGGPIPNWEQRLFILSQWQKQMH